MKKVSSHEFANPANATEETIMKKKSAPQKLSLQTQTIAALQPAELGAAAGGGNTSLYSQACTRTCPIKTPACPI
ncbi:MAG: class I lanthipeptide [Deltaproteobacteria bacterium]|nr:class I lanthipeptide [Deltaproteobacteria bacterium]